MLNKMAKTAKSRKKAAGQVEINYAATLYIEKGMKPEAIAEELGRDKKTVYRWRDTENWDATKELFDTGPTELKKILLKEATRIARGEKRIDNQGNELPPIDADSLSKVMKAYDYMSKKLSPEIFRDAFVDFDNWMVGIDPKLALEFTKYHKWFLQEKIEQEN